MSANAAPRIAAGHISFQSDEFATERGDGMRYSTSSNRSRALLGTDIPDVYLIMKSALMLAALLLALLTARPVAAETVLGTWLSPPDHKGQVGYMRLTPCGSAICGTLVRVFDRNGRETTTVNVGKRLLWDMHAKSSDTFRGRVHVPLLNGNFAAEMKVSGNTLTVRGCSRTGVCRAQTWQRVR